MVHQWRQTFEPSFFVLFFSYNLFTLISFQLNCILEYCGIQITLLALSKTFRLPGLAKNNYTVSCPEGRVTVRFGIHSVSWIQNLDE